MSRTETAISDTTIQRYFYRCSSSCINGLVTPRSEVQNMLFTCYIVWPIPKPLRKIVRKISFQTVVFARNLDERQSRYRHSKTVDFTLLTWTSIYLLNNGIYKGKRTVQTFRCWLHISGLGSRTQSTMGLHSGKRRTKHRNTGICLLF